MHELRTPEGSASKTGAGRGGGGAREQEAARKGQCLESLPHPPPPRGVQACWGPVAHLQQGHPQLPLKSRPWGGGTGSTLAGPSWAPQHLLLPPSLLAPTPAAAALRPGVLQGACCFSAFTGSAPQALPEASHLRLASSFLPLLEGTPVLGGFNLLSSPPHILFSRVSPFL